MIISSIIRTPGRAFIGTLFWLMLEGMLSGQILPVQNMLRAAEAAAPLMPSTHFSAIARRIVLRGSSLVDLCPQMGALAPRRWVVRAGGHQAVETLGLRK